MNILQTLLSSDNGALVKQLAGQFGLDGAQVDSAIRHLVPTLSQGIKHNVSQGGGLESLLAALKEGNHANYIEQPSQLASSTATLDGNNILGHILGSKDVSRQLAAKASSSTGIGSAILKQMLPLLATAAMGMLSKQSGSGNLLQGLLGAVSGGSNTASSQGGLTSMLTGFLDSNNDGSVFDDVLGMLMKRSA